MFPGLCSRMLVTLARSATVTVTWFEVAPSKKGLPPKWTVSVLAPTGRDEMETVAVAARDGEVWIVRALVER